MPDINQEGLVTTGVDRLVEYLKGKNPVTLAQVADYLGVPEKTVEEWVDFLVEEKIISVDYKFTTPYIYLKDKESKTLQDVRTDFERNSANIEGIDTSKSWKDNMISILQKKKAFFEQEAKKRGFTNTDGLWEEYQKRVIEKV